MARILVLTGGGIKAAVVAARAAAGNFETVLVHVDYGQPSSVSERIAINELVETLPSARVVTFDLPHIAQLQRVGLSDTTERSVQGELSSETATERGGVLPGASLRGLMTILMSVGVQCGLRLGASAVLAGLTRSCNGAHLGLPSPQGTGDCRRDFVHSFNIMLESALPERAEMNLEAPLMDATYPQIIQLAQRFKVRLERTWTCLHSKPRPCGTCDPCRARSIAFAGARLVDPLTTPTPAPAPAPAPS